MEGDVFEGGGDVFHKNKITGLQAVSVNGKGNSGKSGLEKFRDGGGVGSVGILAGSIDIKKAESGGGERAGEADFLASEFGGGVRASGGGGQGFVFGHDRIVAVDGAGASENEAGGPGESGGFENKAGASDIHLPTARGMGDGFGDADHGGKMKDVGYSRKGLGEEMGLQNRTVDELMRNSAEIGLVSRGEIVENSDGSILGKTVGEVTSNKASPASNERSH